MPRPVIAVTDSVFPSLDPARAALARVDPDIRMAESAGADYVQISLNRGVLPHEMFMEQIRRFARDVLPALQAHRVERVPLA